MEKWRSVLLLVASLSTLLSGTAGLLCDGVDINPVSSICCNGLVYVRSGIRQACCGNVAYDSHHFMCCDNRTIVRRGGTLPRCCGGQGYDALREECVDGYLDRRTNLGSTCCQTESGWKCCKNGESCCRDTYGSGAPVEIPGFRPACCDIQNVGARAGCCARTAESVSALPPCCDEEAVKPICCWKQDGEGMECCPVTIGYCCGRERPPDRAADLSFITYFTTPRPGGDQRPPYREDYGIVPVQPPRRGRPEHSVWTTEAPTRPPPRRPRPRGRDTDHRGRRPDYETGRDVERGRQDPRPETPRRETEQDRRRVDSGGRREIDYGRRVDQGRGETDRDRSRVEPGRSEPDYGRRTDEDRRRVDYGRGYEAEPGRRETDQDRRRVDQGRSEIDFRTLDIDQGRRETDQGRRGTDQGRREIDQGRRGTDQGRREIDQGRRETDQGRRGTDQGRRETDYRRREVDPARRGTDEGRREIDRTRYGVDQGRSEVVDQGGRDTGSVRKWPDDFQTEVDPSRLYGNRRRDRPQADEGYQGDQPGPGPVPPVLGLLHDVAGQEFCGEEMFDAEQHVCCSGRLRMKVGVIPQCCGSRAYDALIFKCCEGVVRRSCRRHRFVPQSSMWRILV